VRLKRKRKPSALGYLSLEDEPLPDDQQGIAVSTYGKVIKRGWDWLGLTPAIGDRVAGLIEAPALSACLTLNKGDFIRSGARGGTYLNYRKAIQEVVSRQLSVWGDSRERPGEPRRKIAGLRDLERVIEDLSEDFPLLSSLVERRRGGQKLLPLGERGKGLEPEVALLDAAAGGPARAPAAEAPESTPQAPEEAAAAPPPAPRPEPASVELPEAKAARRPARYGLSIQFEDRAGDLELARLVESTVWINQAHPAFRRAEASRSAGYHIALSVALALSPLAVEPREEHAFVTAFLSRWGEALGRPRRRRGA